MESWNPLDSEMFVSSSLVLTSDRIDISSEEIRDTLLIIRCIDDSFLSFESIEIDMDDILCSKPFISLDRELFLLSEL